VRLLVVNCVLREDSRRGLDGILRPKLRRLAGAEPDVAYLAEPERLPGPGAHTHLLLTGSELSAAGGAETDGALLRRIRDFMDADRAVLGICYGHQMLARAILGDGACRRADRPEFGWRRTEIDPDPLFDGLEDPVFAHSHYDEVTGLDERFVVIARTDDCAVQAFRYDGRPVWGVQFHPEMDFEAGNAMFAENRASDPGVEAFCVDDLDDPGRVALSERVLANFLRARGG
jgi:GMP synthase (glutamine-hydrolysing)